MRSRTSPEFCCRIFSPFTKVRKGSGNLPNGKRRGTGVRIRRIGACPEDQRQREQNNPEIYSHRIDSFICNVYKNRYRFPFAEINSTNAGFFITNSLLFILTDAPFRRCGAQKTSLESSGRFCFHRSAVPVRVALVRCRVGYFTYLSSQPKNSRFQTSEFWGLKT